jgi:hypothetical protein
MRQTGSRKERIGFYIHLPVTNAFLTAAMTCLVAFDGFVLVAHNYYPTVFSAWLAWSRPLTDFMAQYVEAVDGIRRFMALSPIATRIPLMQNLIACNWAILCACYTVAPVITLVEVWGKTDVVAQDVATAVTKYGDLRNLIAAVWGVTIFANFVLFSSWTYLLGPRSLVYSDTRIPLICLFFTLGLMTTPRWFLVHFLLLFPSSRNILFPPEEPYEW